MTDRIDPTGNRMQATHREPVIDGVFPNPMPQKLPSRNQPVLLSSQLRDDGIRPLASSPQPVYIAG